MKQSYVIFAFCLIMLISLQFISCNENKSEVEKIKPTATINKDSLFYLDSSRIL